MPPEDRDQQFERALERHLRGGSAAACPDAETLAAYHERTLSLEEMAQWKQHIVGCPRCQETLALVEESNAVHAGEWEEIEKMELAIPMLKGAAVHAVSEEAALPVAGAAEAKAPARAVIPVRRISWGWVVTAGAAAAAELIGVAVRERMMTPAGPSGVVQVSQNEEQSANAPAVTVPAASSTPVGTEQAKQLPESNGKMVAGVPSSSDKKAPTFSTPQEMKRVPQKTVPALNAPAAPQIRKEEPRRDQSPSTDVAQTGVNELSSTYADAARAKDLSAGRQMSQQMQTPAPAAGGASAPNQGAVSGRLTAQQSQAAKAKVEQAYAEHVAVTSAETAGQSLNEVLPPSGIIVVAPVDAYSWRLGAGGKIEHSTDSSRTWMQQKSGVTVDLTAGVAPTGKICWVVGKAGTVLLTTDGGRHWKQVASPTKEDLAGVDAMDAKRASVWVASHAKSYDTNDGGVTWTPVVNK